MVTLEFCSALRSSINFRVTRLEFLPSPGVTKFHPHIARNVLRNDHRPQQRCENSPPPAMFLSVLNNGNKEMSLNFGWKLETPLSKSPLIFNILHNVLNDYKVAWWPFWQNASMTSAELFINYVILWCPCSRRVPDCEVEKDFTWSARRGQQLSSLIAIHRNQIKWAMKKKMVPNRCSGLFRGWNPTQLCGDS